MMRAILHGMLKRLIAEGELDVIWPDGKRSHYAGAPGAEAAMSFHDWPTVRRVAMNPGLALGEAFMDGYVEPIGCSIYDLLRVLLANSDRIGSKLTLLRWRNRVNRALRPIIQANDAMRSRRNVAHHYDLSGRLYSLFLDQDRQYSCAYFPRGDETIDEAQTAKKRHIAAKLCLDRPELTVLDIGCGWGGMALTLARDYGARVLGVTLSSEQLEEARRRAVEAGLSDRVRFELIDYRSVTEEFASPHRHLSASSTPRVEIRPFLGPPSARFFVQAGAPFLRPGLPIGKVAARSRGQEWP